MGIIATSIYPTNWNFGYKRKVCLETMRLYITYIFLFYEVSAQQYSISVFGFHASDVNMIQDSTSIEFQAQTRGIFDLIWPTNNYYKAKFKPDDFSIKSWEKTIKQGPYKTSISGIINSDGHMVYNKKEKIDVSNDTHNIFSLLAMVNTFDKKILDTKWFEYEHEGNLGRARFIWADSSNVWTLQDSLLCDHYRFDIEIVDSTKNMKTKDYFMNNITSTDIIRELWVTKSKPRRIILAKVTNNFFSVWARIQIDKEL